jgi:hypothetical protein
MHPTYARLQCTYVTESAFTPAGIEESYIAINILELWKDEKLDRSLLPKSSYIAFCVLF